MPYYPQFTIAFNISSTNEQRIEACALYQRALNAKKLSESTPPDGDDIHIMMDIHGVQVLLGPGNAVGKGLENPIICEMRFGVENEFRKAYEALIQEGRDYTLEGPYPWATQLGLVTDKFGIGWALYYNAS
ncbi:MAG: VOC family protein [Anaerolineae bacterium]